MIKEAELNGKKLEYELEYKKVKNINLRVKSDGTVHVSADKRVSQKIIEEFLLSKADFIFTALQRYKRIASQPPKQYFTETEIRNAITEICEKVYPFFCEKGVKYPHIKFRKMVSRWGSCHPVKGIITFNTNLMYAPIECIEYVVLHEFTHFLEPNHSCRFYEELSKLCPDWKIRREKLKEINIQ